MIQIYDLFSLYFVAPIISLTIAQSLKNVAFWIKDKKVTSKYLTTDGGTVSGHSAVMASITTAILITEGLSPLFFLAFFVSLLIFRDAYGVRLESAKQAIIINKLIEATPLKKKHIHHLKELIGHTKRQVIFGILAGVATTIIVSLLIL